VKSILFVCTGNIFRSMTAEYALKAALGTEAIYRVSSAGTQAEFQEMAPYVKARLSQRGLDPAKHQQRRVTADLLNEANLVVAMGLDHRAYLKEQFGREVWLFNQICFGQEEPILDIWEAVPNYQYDNEARVAYGLAVVDYICEAMPHFIENVERFLPRLETQSA
jgi:protein-tyrosine phosphatase